MKNSDYDDQLEISDKVITEFDYNIIQNDIIESHKHHTLFKQASKFRDSEEIESAKVCDLLGSICSMRMTPQSINTPYNSYMEMGDKRTSNLDDITKNDLVILEKLLPNIVPMALKGRLADILWLLSKPRNIENARLAIDCYISIEITSDNWKAGVDDYWERAARLTIQLRGGAEDRKDKIESYILKSIASLSEGSQFIFLWLARYLDELGLADHESDRIANQSLDRGLTLLLEKNYHAARSYLEFSADKYKSSNDNLPWINALLSIANSWEQEGDERSANSNMVAATYYENSIQSYRRIPVKFRLENKVEESINRLRVKLKNSGKAALDEMATFKVSSGDVSSIIEASKKHVAGKDKVEFAFLYFCGITTTIVKNDALESAKLSLAESSLSHIFSNYQLARDGRVISKSGADCNEEDTKIKDEAVRNIQQSLNIKVKAQIIPGLHTLLEEHRISYEMLRILCQQSPIVPESREQLLAKALYAGFEFDFASSVHLLMPQIEHIVRTVLKDSDVHTTTLNADGIDMECGLSTLLDKPETADIFDEDLLFELQILLADSKGPNLRNEVAHGLLDDFTSATTASVYIWWRILKLVISAICLPDKNI